MKRFLSWFRRRLLVCVMVGTGVRLRGGDTVLVAVDGFLAEEQVATLRAAFEKNHPGVKVVVLGSEMVGDEPDMSEVCNGARSTVVLVLAYRTRQDVVAQAILLLEYAFLRRVVHAGLAKIVRAAAILARFYLREDKNAFRKLVKVVLRPLRFLLFKLSDACFELSFSVFERLNLLAHRRHFLLCLKRGVLDLEDPVINVLQRVGDLRVITGRHGGFDEVE